MKKIYIHMLVMVLLFAAAPFVASARTGSDDVGEGERVNRVTTNEDSDVTEAGPLAMTSSDVERSTKLEERKKEMEARLAEKKAQIAEKLAGKRAEACEKKASRINNILDNRGRYLQTHMNKFNTIRDRIVAFVAKKELTSKQLTALEAAMNNAQTDAQAAIDAIKETDFVCNEADATNPGGFVKDTAEEAKTAIKAYRDAIKAYAKEARTLATAAEEAAQPSDDATADQGTGDTTGGAQ